MWHGALTRAADEGGPDLLAAVLAAQDYFEGRARYVEYRHHEGAALHTLARRPDGAAVAEVPGSPFPAQSKFGILAYAVWHGHAEVVRGLAAAEGIHLEAAAVVSPLDCNRQRQLAALAGCMWQPCWVLVALLWLYWCSSAAVLACRWRRGYTRCGGLRWL